MWGFPSLGLPLVMVHFHGIFSNKNHPAMGLPPWLWNPPHLWPQKQLTLSPRPRLRPCACGCGELLRSCEGEVRVPRDGAMEGCCSGTKTWWNIGRHVEKWCNMWVETETPVGWNWEISRNSGCGWIADRSCHIQFCQRRPHQPSKNPLSTLQVFRVTEVGAPIFWVCLNMISPCYPDLMFSHGSWQAIAEIITFDLWDDWS